MPKQQEFLSDLHKHFPDFLEDFREHVKDQFVATISRESLPTVATYAIKQLGARFVISVATDRREISNDFGVSYMLAFDENKKFLVLHSHVPADDLKVGSITRAVPAADWSEREAYDMLGVVPEGHPDFTTAGFVR